VITTGAVDDVPVVVACTANADAFSSSSTFRQFITAIEGVVVRKPKSSLLENLPPYHERIVRSQQAGVRVLVEHQLHRLGRKILHRARVKVERELFVETLWIDIRIARHLRALPLVGELAARERQPLVPHRVEGDVTAVKANRLAIEEVSESFVGGRRIAQRTGSQRYPGDEVFIQLAIKSKSNSNPCPVAIEAGFAAIVTLEEAFASHSNVSIEPEASQQTFQGRHPLFAPPASRPRHW
jgi:hypothetical protein